MTMEIWQSVLLSFDRAMEKERRRAILLADNCPSHLEREITLIAGLSTAITYCVRNRIDAMPLTDLECKIINNCSNAVIQRRVTDYFPRRIDV